MNALERSYKWSRRDYLEGMRNGWGGGLSEGTPCGAGSTMTHTQNVRRWLPDVIARYAITSICDAGAGDLNWIRTLDLTGVRYLAFDIHPRDPQVQEADICAQVLPSCDLILCRHVLNHLPPHLVVDALELFKHSGRYLLATTHVEKTTRLDAPTPFSRWDLSREPFGLGEPLESIEDCRDHKLALWRLR